MKNILVLGAGMISRPLIRYLLDQPEFFVNVATRTVSKAEKTINGHEDGKAVELDVHNDKKLENLITNAEVVVSLLPYKFHVKVAKLCIKHNKHLVTTSYVSKEMKALDEKAKRANVILLNECGLDPGIDHMSAMRIIHDVKENNGKIISFKSQTGALPSFEDNNNPFGYKFSWSPRGVLLASRNPARWLENGEKVSVPGEKLFENYKLQDVPGVGTFENYPNRDSIPYKEIYGLQEAETVYRGTFRMTGWCETLRNIMALGWLSEKQLEDFSGRTYADLTRFLVNADKNENLPKATAKYLDIKTYSAVIKRLKWLGLFEDILLPEDKKTPLDYLNVLTLQKMPLRKKEKDMIVMHHEFIADFPSKKEYITSTLLEHGIPNGDSAVARTVALPAAIAVKMIINKKIKSRGVKIPVEPSIYNPILNELEEIGIKFKEHKKTI